MYYCVHCAHPNETGLLCSSCLASQASSSFPVLYCNFCGSAINQRGTQCKRCETAHEAQYARVMVKVRREESEQQPTLWTM